MIDSNSMEIDSILKEYHDLQYMNQEFCRKVETIICDVLTTELINVSSVTSRVKGEYSLIKKIKKGDGKYKTLSDITDVVGVRIITYFADQIDQIAEIIKQEFSVIPEHSVDKRQLMEPERFGYLSLHYVAQLSKQRSELTENVRFKDFTVEFQIRSILQHAWAEIEHDLGYKTELEIPKDTRRDFSRLAGLLELADKEFTNIKKSLDDYALAVKQQISNIPHTMEIDGVSLQTYIQNSELVTSIEQAITEKTHSTIDRESTVSPDMVITRLAILGIHTIAELDDLMRTHSETIVNFVADWTQTAGEFSAGISVFYLCYVVVGERRDLQLAIRLFLPDVDQKSAEKASRHVLTTYNRIIKNEQ